MNLQNGRQFPQYSACANASRIHLYIHITNLTPDRVSLASLTCQLPNAKVPPPMLKTLYETLLVNSTHINTHTPHTHFASLAVMFLNIVYMLPISQLESHCAASLSQLCRQARQDSLTLSFRTN